MYLLITPILYRKVSIDFGLSRNPLFYSVSNSPAPGRARRYFSKLLSKSIHSIPSRKSQQSSREEPTGSTHHPMNPLPARFTFTRSLRITSHRHTDCRGFAPLYMPNLVELHICPSPLEDSLNACYCKHHDQGGCPSSAPACHCILLAQIECEKVIFGGWSSGLTGSAMGLWPSSWPQPPRRVKKVIIPVGRHSGTEFRHGENPSTWLDCTHTLVDALPASVDRLVFVSNDGEGEWADRNRYDDASGWWDREELAFRPGRAILRKSIARACAGKAAEIEVIGLGEEGYDYFGGEEEAPRFRTTLETYLVTRAGWDREEARRRAQTVILTSGLSYDTEDSEGEGSAE